MQAIPTALRRVQVFTSFRYGIYRLFWLHMLLTHTGLNIRQVVQPWLALTLTDSPFLVGVVASAMFLPTLVLAPIGGVAADRVERKQLITLTIAVNVVVMFLLGSLVATNLIAYWQILLLALISGSAMSFYMPGRQALMPSLVGREDLTNAVALASLVTFIARAAGPFLASLILARADLASAFLVGAASYGVGLILLILLQVRSLPVAGKETVRENLIEGLRYVKGNVALSAILLLVALGGLFGAPYVVLLPVIARDILGVGAAGLGVLAGANGVGAVAGALILSAMGSFNGKGWFLLGSALAFGAALVLLSFAGTMASALIVLFLAGASWTFLNTLANTLLQLLTPDAFRGRVMSLYVLAFNGTTSVGYIPAGAAAGLLGVPPTLVLGGVIVIGLAVAMASHPSLRKLE